ncbi:hypothetical protein KSS87_021516, partial [Heliosperma pusillum]
DDQLQDSLYDFLQERVDGRAVAWPPQKAPALTCLMVCILSFEEFKVLANTEGPDSEPMV